jgi:Tetratricopeptide repeat
VVRDLGKPAEAQPLFERALRIYEASYGPDHPTTRQNLHWIQELHRGLFIAYPEEV